MHSLGKDIFTVEMNFSEIQGTTSIGDTLNTAHSIFGILIIVLLLLTTSCSTKRDALGSPDKIIVVVDSTQWLEISEAVKSVFEQIFYSPQPEPAFVILPKKPDELGALRHYPNMLLIGTLDGDNDMHELFDNMLTENARNRVLHDSVFLFSRHDPWAQNQLLGLAIAKDMPTLKKNLQKQGEQLFSLFDKHLSATMFRDLFEHFEQKELSKALMHKHGWNVRVPHDYYVAVDSSELRLVWLRRFNPQRWISVYWEPADDPSMLSKEWMLNRRNEIIHPIYDGDYIYEDDLIQTQEQVVDFNERYAIRLDGVWQNDKHVMGGPFRSFAFYDEHDGRLYMIDLAVFAPGQRKYQFVRQMEGIAATFRTTAEM